MTKEINIGGCLIGNSNPIAIQSMTNTRTKNVDSTREQIFALEKVGCNIVRVAVLDIEDALAIKDIKSSIHIPLVADIHFNHALALLAMENGADKIRINPGNISKTSDLDKVIDCAKNNGVAIRIGANSGSVNKSFLEKYSTKSQALVESLLSQVRYFEKRGFYDLVLSVKSTNVIETVDINKKLSQHCDYPLHIGITEAGPKEIGVIKNSIGIGSLLLNGIGDTIRVSLTDNPIEEVLTAKNILRSCGKKIKGINFVSCPTCGRCMVDMVPLANQIYDRIKTIDAPILVAVMGCPVNGPGEAKDADIGIAFGGNNATLFKNGKIVAMLPLDNVVDNFVKQVEELAKCY